MNTDTKKSLTISFEDGLWTVTTSGGRRDRAHDVGCDGQAARPGRDAAPGALGRSVERPQGDPEQSLAEGA